MTTKRTKKPAPKRAPSPKRPAKDSAPATPPTPAATTHGTKPTTKRVPPTRNAPPAEAHVRDPRLPAPGTVLTRAFQGKEIQVEVLDAGFKYDGKTWRSLSAIARAVAQVSWNGFLFFNLQKRPSTQPTDAAPGAKDGAK